MKKRNSNYFIRGIRYLQNPQHSVGNLILKMEERLYRDYLEKDYHKIMVASKCSETELERQNNQVFEEKILFSILVPVYNTPKEFLREMIESCQRQSYGNWELCIADGSTLQEPFEVIKEYMDVDSRIKYKKLKENKGISENTNEALEMAKGDFICLFDHDDILEPDALYEMMKVLMDEPKTDIIYTDEDKLESETNRYFGPNFKPDFDINLLRTNNYICHFFAVRKTIVRRIGGFRKEFDGAQDYDFILRCVESTMEIRHIPKVLYHWRTHSNSTAASPESKLYAYQAAKKSVQAHFERCGMSAIVENTKNYGFFQWQVRGLSKENVKVLEYDLKDTGRTLSELAQKTKAQVLIFRPKDMKVLTEDYQDVLSGFARIHGCGVVGCKNLFQGKVLEAGLITTRDGCVSYFSRYAKRKTGYFHRLCLNRSVMAVSMCFAVEHQVLERAGYFREDISARESVVDLCFRLKEAGYTNMYTPLVQTVYLGKKQGMESINLDMGQYKKDPYYNENCDEIRGEYRLRSRQ